MNLKPIDVAFEGAERFGYERHVTEKQFLYKGIITSLDNRIGPRARRRRADIRPLQGLRL